MNVLGDLDYALLGIAVRMKLEEIRRNDRRVNELVLEIALGQIDAPKSVIPRAAQGRSLRPENLRRVLDWLGRDGEDFKRRGARP